ncbi:4'-phosphopantetheinyl transferase family protein [Streptomyces albidus (ex Kaewkla and Franco 2022)]|uniref:4'-phosphopantetheinyl transferase family protein n=1 Tax=Streptomyces albidus (ex Kaewkla and Franco 2022) TaxID=722709 RepID=UPI001F28CC7D|nr:4'-phosphopantetheinyl transferase superfamily protein [Streptomyces albidus (ex Kaewkla and Franco 2022)]
MSRLRADLDGHAAVLLHADIADWQPREAEGPWLRALLGCDWERYRKLRLPFLRERFAASRLMLKYAVAAVAGVSPLDVELGRTAAGRPYLHGCDAIHISLSHTENLLLVGLSTGGAIGVDVEAGDRPLYGPGLGRHMCTPHELAAVEAMPPEERNPQLLRLWTLKEACSKALGIGLGARFTDFGFGADDGAPPRLHRPDGTPAPVGPREWNFHTFTVGCRYVAAAAVHNPD